MLYPRSRLHLVLDGTLGRVSIAYLVGFLELMFALIVALTYARSRS